MMNEMNLKPRAIAVLTCLRRGPLTLKQIQHRIGDNTIDETGHLVAEMTHEHLIARHPDLGIMCDEDGRAWLESHGVSIGYGRTYDGAVSAYGVYRR